MTDVIVVGAGPAGSVAASVLARAGARVLLIDRARFPRPKLCGDTLNPGVLALLERLQLGSLVATRGLKLPGMILTGENGASVQGRYPGSLYGRSIARADLDWALVRDAVNAGAELIEGVSIREPLVESVGRSEQVVGVRTGSNGTSREFRAPVTICADGRHSALAFWLGLAWHPVRPRRWAIGAYFQGAAGISAFGEMHIRRRHYFGIAALPDGIVNLCLVKPSAPGDPALHDPLATIKQTIASEGQLRDRFTNARLVAGPTVLGPLAVDTASARDIPRGLLLAGDASGFVDPITGDGLRFAMRGAELAALAALNVLKHGWDGVREQLDADRRREFESKSRLNRAIRAIVGSPLAVRAGTVAAPYAPWIFQALIARAGDCDLVEKVDERANEGPRTSHEDTKTRRTL